VIAVVDSVGKLGGRVVIEIVYFEYGSYHYYSLLLLCPSWGYMSGLVTVDRGCLARQDRGIRDPWRTCYLALRIPT
jgi:hypothetical protein